MKVEQVYIEPKDLQHVEQFLDTGHAEDYTRVFEEKEGMLQFDNLCEEGLMLDRKVRIHPELALHIHDEVKRIGRRNLEVLYERSQRLNTMDLKGFANIPKHIEQMVIEGMYDDVPDEVLERQLELYEEEMC